MGKYKRIEDVPENERELQSFGDDTIYTGKELSAERSRRNVEANREAAKQYLKDNDTMLSKAGAYASDLGTSIKYFPSLRGVSEAKAVDKLKSGISRAKKATSEEGLDASSSERGFKKGGMIKSSASKRADGCAQRGKTRGKMI